MKDFDICMGTGDYPTNELDNPNYESHKETQEEVQKYLDKGYVKDSTGRWYNQKDYIDTLYADW